MESQLAYLTFNPGKKEKIYFDGTGVIKSIQIINLISMSHHHGRLDYLATNLCSKL